MALPIVYGKTAQDWRTMLAQAQQDPTGTLKALQDKYAGRTYDQKAGLEQMATLGGSAGLISGMANGFGGGQGFGDGQKREAIIDSMLANELVNKGTSNSHMSPGFMAQNFSGSVQYDPEWLRQTRRMMDAAGGVGNFFGSTADSTQEQMDLQWQLGNAAENPFAGQNLSDESVKAQVREYQKTHPDYIPINTYRGEAPRLPGDINQDTGMPTMEGVSGQNPWATNRGFVQTDLLQGARQPQQTPYQAPQQNNQNPYLQPFQQTQQYQKAMNTNYASGNQPQAKSYWGSQGAFGNGTQSNSYGSTNNNFQSPFQFNQNFGKNQFQMQGQQQSGGLLGGSNPYGNKKYGLLG